MHSIEEKRVYGDREGALEAYVSSSMGVVRVRIAGDTVGEFGLCERCDARDVAATAERVAIATDEDVRVFERGARTGNGEEAAPEDAEPTFDATGFGEAVAVGYDGADLVAAGPDGTIACRAADGDEWATLEDETVATVRAIDGDLIGTDSGVYRVHDGGLDHVGLTDVRDVSAAGVPLAATDEGLYKLGNGWMEVFDEPFDAVAADPVSEPGRLSRAHAVSSAGALYGLESERDEWTDVDGPADGESILAIGYGETIYAVTKRGTFLARVDGTGEMVDAVPATGAADWRSRSLGIRNVTGLAVPPLE